jgi:AcrR family transcriptional regulator
MSVYDRHVAKSRTLLPPDQRRQQLLAAATSVFARKGYRRASISDIIDRAGVARGTFYLYFKSKEQVFLAIVDDYHKKISLAITTTSEPPAQPLTDPEGILRISFRRWLGFFAANRDATTVILKEASSIDPRFEKGFAELRRSAVDFFAARYRRFQELGIVRPSIRPVLMAHLLIGMFDELLNAFVLTDTDADLDALAAQLADFEWNGIRPH